MKLCTAAEMRALEEAAVAAGTPTDVLMENAGLAVAQEVWIGLGAMQERKVVVLAGPGNNGGDGLVAARHLHGFDTNVTVVLVAPRSEDDPNLKQLIERGVDVRALDGGLEQLEDALDGADVVVDALLGTGRARPLEGNIAAALDRIVRARSSPAPPQVVAVDLPTGIDADTGAADPHALVADVTVALGVSKAGLHTLPGAEYAGRVEVADIGLSDDAVEALPVELLNARWVRAQLPPRPAGGNKGTFGRVLVVAGSKLYVGAARLTALAALRSGAGLVTLACPASVQPQVAAAAPEVTYLPLPERDGFVAPEAARDVARAVDGYDALAIGPGLGQGPSQQGFIRQLLPSIAEASARVVVDADGLNNLAKLPRWWERVRAPCVVTPHPGEQGRLTYASVADVQADRLGAARAAARAWMQTVVLKGAYTVVASPGERAAVNPYANPALATAGTGDVLTGCLAGFLAQGLDPFQAACCAVYLHAAAAEGLRPELGDAGLLAGDLLPELPRTLRELRALA